MTNPDRDELVKRPVAFRVRQHRLSNYYELYTDEKDAQFWAENRGIEYEGLYLVADRYLAPPADAGMREAFVRVLASLAAAISILERTPKAKKAVASDKMFDTMLDDYRKALEAGRAALTAPGATTKSDGGAKAGSSPILANKEDQRPDTHGMMPVGDNAANVGSTGVGPSEPSSTRSEVTVEFGELVDDLLSVTAEVRRQNWKNGGAHLYDDEDAARKITRALLDQFQIRRK